MAPRGERCEPPNRHRHAVYAHYRGVEVRPPDIDGDDVQFDETDSLSLSARAPMAFTVERARPTLTRGPNARRAAAFVWGSAWG